MIRNIVFDLGGVLFELDREEALRRFAALGVPDVEKMLDPYLQSGVFLAVEDGSMSREQFRAALSELARRELTDKEVGQAYLGFIKQVDAYKFDYIDQLRKEGYRIFILSNTNPYVMDFAESNHFLPNGRPLSSYCDHKFASCQMGCVKPQREIFEQMITQAPLNPSETLFVDDGAANVAMGQELGMITYRPQNGEDWRAAITELLTQHK